MATQTKRVVQDKTTIPILMKNLLNKTSVNKLKVDNTNNVEFEETFRQISEKTYKAYVGRLNLLCKLVKEKERDYECLQWIMQNPIEVLRIIKNIS